MIWPEGGAQEKVNTTWKLWEEGRPIRQKIAMKQMHYLIAASKVLVCWDICSPKSVRGAFEPGLEPADVGDVLLELRVVVTMNPRPGIPENEAIIIFSYSITSTSPRKHIESSTM